MTRLTVAALLAVWALSGRADADTLYVTDRLAVAVYERPGRNAPVRTLATSDTAVERLVRQGAFSRVRLPDGTEGWVEDIYLTPTPTAALRLAAAQRAPMPAPVATPALPRRSGGLGVAGALGLALFAACAGLAGGWALREWRLRVRLHGLRI